MTARSAFFALWTVLSVAAGNLSAQDMRLYLQRPASLPNQPSVRFGSAITSVADRDGDGIREILIGDDGYMGGKGEVIAFSQTGTVIGTFALNFAPSDATERLGSALCDVGVDAGGTVLYAVGAPGFDGVGVDSGRVAIQPLGGSIFPVAVISGLTPGEEFGSVLATLGDLDGDGLAEFLVGAPKANIGGANAGRVSLINGSTGTVIYSVNGVPGSLFGSSIAAGKDVNSDGIPDFVVGAPNDSTVGTNRGRAFVMSGSTGVLIMTLNGNSNGDNFGRAVTLLNDLDGDGRAEIAVSAPGDDVGMSNNGAVTIHAGVSGAILRTAAGEVTGDLWGQALSAGDADHDGKDDLLVGSPLADRSGTNDGVAVLYSGADGSVIWRAEGHKTGGEFGHAVAFLGDFAGSGLSEFAVTEWKFERAASIVSFAPPAFPRIHATPKSDLVFEIGDIDGDGRRDIAFRETPPSITELPARVSLMSSVTRRIVRRLSGTSFGNGSSVGPDFGRSVCDVGDVDSDGVDDVVVTEYLSSSIVGVGGTLYLYSGATGSLLLAKTVLGHLFGAVAVGIGDANGNGEREVVIAGISDGSVSSFDLPSGNLAWSTMATAQAVQVSALDVVGDVNGDGKYDVVVGSKTDRPIGTPPTFDTEGSAKVLSGADGSIIYGYLGAGPNLFVGEAVAGVRDQNGDGCPDFAINSVNAMVATLTVYSGQTGLPLMTMTPGGNPTAVDDLTGDGIADIVVTDGNMLRYFEGGTGMSLGGSIAFPSSGSRRLIVDDLNGDSLPEYFVAGAAVHGEFAAAGAFVRGESVKGNQRLSLTWNAASGTTPTDGTVEISHGAPFSIAFLLISLSAKTTAFGPYIAYLDVFDPSLLSFAIPLGGVGEAGFFTDLHDPVLANFVLHFQVVDTTTGPDGLYSMSNGLSLRFMP